MKITEFEIGKSYCLPENREMYDRYKDARRDTTFSLAEILRDDWEEYNPKLHLYVRIKREVSPLDKSVREAIIDILDLDLKGRTPSLEGKHDLRLERIEEFCIAMCDAIPGSPMATRILEILNGQ
jgi:hypothetical protein